MEYKKLEGRITNVGWNIIAGWSIQRLAYEALGRERTELARLAQEHYRMALEELYIEHDVKPKEHKEYCGSKVDKHIEYGTRGLFELNRGTYRYIVERIYEVTQPLKSIRAPPGYNKELGEPQWEVLFKPTLWLEPLSRKKFKQASYMCGYSIRAGEYHIFLYSKQGEFDNEHYARNPGMVAEFIGDFTRQSDAEVAYVVENARDGEITKSARRIDTLLPEVGLQRGIYLPSFENDLQRFYDTHEMFNSPIEKLIWVTKATSKQMIFLKAETEKGGIETVQDLIKHSAMPISVTGAKRRMSRNAIFAGGITKKEQVQAIANLEETVYNQGLSFMFPIWRLT